MSVTSDEALFNDSGRGKLTLIPEIGGICSAPPVAVSDKNFFKELLVEALINVPVLYGQKQTGNEHG